MAEAFTSDFLSDSRAPWTPTGQVSTAAGQGYRGNETGSMQLSIRLTSEQKVGLRVGR